MKNNKIPCAIFVFIIGGIIWWNASSSIKKNSPADVLIETPIICLAAKMRWKKKQNILIVVDVAILI